MVDFTCAQCYVIRTEHDILYFTCRECCVNVKFCDFCVRNYTREIVNYVIDSCECFKRTKRWLRRVYKDERRGSCTILCLLFDTTPSST